jgi:cellulose synthase/poly-beta-1,6-N-acetylglucosamine synthase-like glycosyltransferase
LEPSVSIFVPVCNAQSDLETQVERILDLLPEVTSQFDVLIIDDGSTDETAEIARNLAARYPQVEAIRLETSLGVDEAIRAGLKHRPGGVVMVHTSEMPLDAQRLRRFCQPHGASRPPKVARKAKMAAHATSTFPANTGMKPKASPATERKSADLSALVERLMGWGPPWPRAGD